MQAWTVKDLPDMERLKAAKFTGLRWDIDPVVIEYFRYLLNDVVEPVGRKTSSSSQTYVPSSTHGRSLKSTSAMLTTDRALSVDSSDASAGNKDARRRSMFRQFSTVQPQLSDDTDSPPNRALARWKKVSSLK